MSKTKISWTEKTINPIMGCSLISTGCSNCYAMKMAHRLQAIGVKGYEGTTEKLKSGKVVWTGKLNFNINKMLKEVKTKRPTMFFVNSMSDLFHEKVSFEIIEKCWDVMCTNPRHTYQILTKRPQRLLEFCEYESDRLAAEGYEKINSWTFEIPNFIWVGVSVENQETADERIPLLLQTPAAVRWLSVEPMLEPIDLMPYHYHIGDSLDFSFDFDWVVVGCESGHNRRPCKIEWIESIVDQCREAKIPIFVKQLSINGKVVKDIEKFPEHLKVRQFPSKLFN